MDQVRAIKLIALKNAALEPDAEAEWRRIARFYSRTFHTPLHLVDELPRIDVLQAYFEEVFDNLDDNELHQEIEKVLKQDTLESSVEKAKEDALMEDLVKQTQEENRKAGQASPQRLDPDEEVAKIPPVETDRAVLEALDGLGATIANLRENFTEEGFGLDKP